MMSALNCQLSSDVYRTILECEPSLHIKRNFPTGYFQDIWNILRVFWRSPGCIFPGNCQVLSDFRAVFGQFSSNLLAIFWLGFRPLYGITHRPTPSLSLLMGCSIDRFTTHIVEDILCTLTCRTLTLGPLGCRLRKSA